MRVVADEECNPIGVAVSSVARVGLEVRGPQHHVWVQSVVILWKSEPKCEQRKDGHREAHLEDKEVENVGFFDDLKGLRCSAMP